MQTLNHISIIVPSYNSQFYIVETISSALGQVGVEVEVIVVDDGSTDDTRKTLIDSNLMSKIKYIYQENQGPSQARNTGLNNATGEFCCFLDSDDILDSKFCLELSSYLEDCNEHIVYCNYEYFLDKLNTKVDTCFPKYEKDVFKNLISKNFIPTPAVLFRRNSLKGIQFDTKLKSHEDWWFWVQASLQYNIYYYPKILTKIRKRKGSATTHLNIMATSYSQVVQKIEELMLSGPVEINKSDLIRFYYGHACTLIVYKFYKQAFTMWRKLNACEINLKYNLMIISRFFLESTSILAVYRKIRAMSILNIYTELMK